jgi:hypothetical protein
MREGFFFSMAILLAAAFILGSMIWSMHLKDTQDTESRAALAKMCIERQGLWIDQSKNCVFQPGNAPVTK